MESKFKLNKEKVTSPPAICALYCIACALVIAGFRFLFPGEEISVPGLSVRWRLIRGAIAYLNWYPALFLSGLIIPFGLKDRESEQFSPFSPELLKFLKLSIVTALAGVGVYGLFFFLSLPAARDYEANLRFGSELYKLAKERARDYAARGEWAEVFHFVAICDRIWPASPEIAELRNESTIRMEKYRVILERPLEDIDKNFSLQGNQGRPAALSGPPGEKEPVDAGEALSMAGRALEERRYYDAHWLATLAGRLAKPGSPEQAEAVRLSGMAWNGVTAMAPGQKEEEAYRFYRLKRDGYEAMQALNWVEAYYTFRELRRLAPSDREVAEFLNLSERGVSETAFFIDEFEESMGEIQTGAIFSLPTAAPGSVIGELEREAPLLQGANGRIALRIDALSVFPDFAYGQGVSLIAVDREGRPAWSIETNYAKIMPVSLGGLSLEGNVSRVALLTRALNRYSLAESPETVIVQLTEDTKTPQAGTPVLLDITWEDFLLLIEADRGIDQLQPPVLRAAAARLNDCGFLPQVFQSELIYRFAEPLMLLPISILAIILGWRYRALKKPRYIGIPMLVVLPLVLNGLVHFYRGWINGLGTWSVIGLGYTPAIIAFIAGEILLFFASLVILAGQHS